jgi:hypothetical protein
MRFLAALEMTLMAIALTGCTVDPCTFDKSSPSCAVKVSESQATISAIDGAREMRETDSAVNKADQATKSALSSQATLRAMDADATRDASDAQATRDARNAQATQSAVVYESTRTSVDGEATKIALNVGSAIVRSKAENTAAPYNAAFNVVVFWFLLPALIVVAVIVYGQRTVKRVTEAAAAAVTKRAAMVRYGPANDPRIGFLTFSPETGQPVKFITAEGMIGNFADLLTGKTLLTELNVPDQMKLAAAVEAAKRTAAKHIAAATGTAPWAGTALTQSFYEERQALESPAAAAEPESVWKVPTFAELLRTWKPSVDQMLFGFGEDGQPVYGSLDQLLSALVIGRQGQGKTTLLRLIDVQCQMVGARVIAWDIHDDIAEDVPGVVTYSRVTDIEQSAQEMEQELERRIRLKLKHEKAQPIMVLVDEVNEIAEQVPDLPKVIKRIVSEGRKYRIFEFITAKGAPADIFEKSWARDSFSALISFWTSALQARNAGFEADSARRVETLTPGRALLRLQTSPAQVVTFPDLSLTDMQNMVSGPASKAASEPLPESPWMVSGEAEKAAETSDFEDVEAANKAFLARKRLKEGRSQREVIAELWGANGGRAYQQASEELRKIIQEAIQ